MKILDFLFGARRRFNEQVDSLLAWFDYGRESDKIDALLADFEAEKARIDDLLQEAVPSDYLCERPDCDGVYLPRKGRRGPFLGCSRYPECRSTKDAPTREAPYERRPAWMMISNAAIDLKVSRRFENSRRKARKNLRYILRHRSTAR